MIKEQNLKAIESSIIGKTEEFNQLLKQNELLTQEISMIKTTLIGELKKTAQSVNDFSAVVIKSSNQITKALNHKETQVQINLSDETIDELAMAVNNLENIILKKKIISLVNVAGNFALMIAAYTLVNYFYV